MTARLVIRKSSLQGFTAPLVLYAAGCALAAIQFQWNGAWLPTLLLAGAISVMVAWGVGAWPDVASRYLSFGALMLLVCVLNRVFYLADYFYSGPLFSDWPFWTADAQAATFKGEVISVVGTLMTVLGWKICGGRSVSPTVILVDLRNHYRTLQVLYASSLLGIYLSFLDPKLASTVGQLLPVLLALGAIAGFLIPMLRFSNDMARFVATVVLAIPSIGLASVSGMKQNIILSLVPVAVMAWRVVPGRAGRLAMILIGLSSLALITSYVNLYRQEVWMPAARGMPVTESVPQEFAEKIEKDGVGATVGEGLGGFVQRMNMSYAHGWAVSIADEQGFQTELMLAPLTYVFVPRLLWPAKPKIQTGWKYSGLVFGEDYMQWSSSSTAAGFYPALYLGLGWPAVIFGALAAGAVLAAMTRLTLRLGGTLAAGLYIFAMLPFILRLDENWPVSMLSGPVITCVYVLVALKLARIAAGVLYRMGGYRVRTPAVPREMQDS